MIYLTKAQRKAVRRVYERTLEHTGTYREFRKMVLGGSGCVMLYWCGMWLGIEPDGYTHS